MIKLGLITETLLFVSLSKLSEPHQANTGKASKIQNHKNMHPNVKQGTVKKVSLKNRG